MDFTERFRPVTFSEFFPVLKYENMLRGQIHRKLLISGPTGCGKTTLAKLIVAGVNCHNDPRPCGKCANCINAQSSLSFDIVYVNCISQGIKTIRELRDKLAQVTVVLDHRVVILDNAQQLTSDAQFQLLTILDSFDCYFILCTVDPSKISCGILDRCMQLHVSPLSEADAELAAKKILKKAAYTKDIKVASKIITQRSRGVPRRILIEAQALCSGIVKEEIINEFADIKALVYAKDYKRGLTILRQLKESPDNIRRRILSYCTQRLELADERISRFVSVLMTPLVVDAAKFDLMYRLYRILESDIDD